MGRRYDHGASIGTVHGPCPFHSKNGHHHSYWRNSRLAVITKIMDANIDREKRRSHFAHSSSLCRSSTNFVVGNRTLVGT
eukprot:scaffold297_cov171-Amphora_coffeaeformis.AAC.4